MIHTFAISLLTVCLGLLAQVHAAATPGATFAGCVLATSVSLGAGARVGSQAACNTRCANSGNQFSYYIRATVLATSNNCFCRAAGNDVGAVNYVVPEGGILTEDTVCLPALQAAKYDVSTTFVFQNCVGTLTGVTVNLLQGTILGGSLVSDPHACFASCANSAQAYFIPIVPSVAGVVPTYGCVCNPSGSGQALLCGVGTFFRYNHMADASGQARRRQLQAKALHAEKVRRRSFCPGKMLACSIPGAEDSWECVDPTSDLESCGGCTHSEFIEDGLFNKTATGTDCSSLPGNLLGASTCTDGRCVAFACKRGWVLIDGQCVRP